MSPPPDDPTRGPAPGYQRFLELVQGLDAIVWEADVAAPTAESPDEIAGRRFTFVSDRAEAILGYPVHQWFSERNFWVNHLHADYRHVTLSQSIDAIRDGRDYVLGYCMLAADGGVVWLRDRVHVVRGADGRVAQLRGVAVDITERRLAQEALERSEARNRAILNAIPDLMFRISGTGDFLGYHAQDTRDLHVPPDQIIGKKIEELLPPAVAGPTRHHVELALATGEPQVYEYALAVPNGLQNFECRLVTCGKDEVLAVVRNITARRQAEEALRRSEERYRSFISQSSEGIWLYESDEPLSVNLPEDEQIRVIYEHGRLVECNDAMARMYGFSRAEEIAGLSIAETLVPTDPANIEYLRKFIRSGYRLTDAESHEVDRYGNRRTFVNNLIGIVENGYLVRAWGTQRDVTEWKAAEEELRFRREFAESIIETAQAIVLVLDPQGKVMRFNRYMEEVSGYRLDEVEGKEWFAVFLPARDRDRIREVFSRVIRQGHLQGSVNPIVTKDGREREIEWHAKTLTDAAGGTQGVLAIGLDITERRQLEEQLRQSQKMEAVGRLAGGVAHDFNNLLTAIMGYSDLLLMRLGEGHPLRRQVEEIKNAGERAKSLTQQLLAFSRKQVLQPQILDLNAIIREMDKMLRAMIGEDIELRSALEPGLGRIKADRGQIQQVIMNLAVNARDAMPAGGVITIRTQNCELDEGHARSTMGGQPGPHAMLSITDTGQGMDDHVKSHLFEPFFSTKEVGKGTGLGLSTVYGIVKQSGGSISVQSEAGRGASFTIYLPLVEEAARSDEADKVPVILPQGWETVLVVEDDRVVRNMTCEILSMNGYHVLEAANGAEAMDLCARYENTIHLIVTDVVMPGFGGHELAQRLRTTRPATKVVYVSGYADGAVAGQAIVGAPADFLQKPFTPEALARMVREVLDSAVAQ
ncbi:MAG: PAS domain S-box protein [Acidobacteriota bacterium]